MSKRSATEQINRFMLECVRRCRRRASQTPLRLRVDLSAVQRRQRSASLSGLAGSGQGAGRLR